MMQLTENKRRRLSLIAKIPGNAKPRLQTSGRSGLASEKRHSGEWRSQGYSDEEHEACSETENDGMRRRALAAGTATDERGAEIKTSVRLISDGSVNIVGGNRGWE